MHRIGIFARTFGLGAFAALASSTALAAQHRAHPAQVTRFHPASIHQEVAHREFAHQAFAGDRRRFDALAGAGGAQTGGASYYAGRSHRTAAGGHVGAATCAHRTLPFGTRVLVTNLTNALQAVLTVNDRGPFVRGRIVDVSLDAAGRLGMLRSGVATVRIEVVGGPG